MTIESYKEINENTHSEFIHLHDGNGHESGTGYGCGLVFCAGNGSADGEGTGMGVHLTGDADMRAPGIENNK